MDSRLFWKSLQLYSGIYFLMASVTTTFLPNESLSPPFTFSASLYGTTYTVHVIWNMAGQRYYVQLIESSGTVVITHPMISSSSDLDVNLVPGLFPTGNSLTYSSSTNLFTATDSTT